MRVSLLNGMTRPDRAGCRRRECPGSPVARLTVARPHRIRTGFPHVPQLVPTTYRWTLMGARVAVVAARRGPVASTRVVRTGVRGMRAGRVAAAVLVVAVVALT